ncbi:MAG TPA: DUF3891 family protein [Terriglobales bacterium]|nr:DUF3891 family protein [Terriglobales bacterium]
MVIRPEVDDPAGWEAPGQITLPNAFIASQKSETAEFSPAWEPVARRQGLLAASYWLIRQPDHAALSGELAARFRAPGFALPNSDAIAAIAGHDSGWAAFPFEASLQVDPPTGSDGRPMSFLDFGPDFFLPAWTLSIDRAEQASRVGGRMVSGHFYRLGQGRLAAQVDEGGNRRRLQEFLQAEQRRQHRLEACIPISAEQADALVDVLQFCDVLSLYLCCGAQEAVEFPQQLGGRRIRLRFCHGAFKLDPSPFKGEGSQDSSAIRLSVPASRYPHPKGPEIRQLNFELC